MWRAIKHRPAAATTLKATFRRRFLSTPPSSLAAPSTQRYEVGSVIHGFEVLKKQLVPEYSVTAVQLQHVATKAEYLHIDTVDSNNVFSINFRTPPYSSNGIAHILEHLVLCGSKRYPVRDPFFNMLKRSLNNFMNAMTANDHTMYPFATTNAKDFENLLGVYLDAVFFPTLHPLDFSQEGHRVEWSDDNSTLQFKGVVLNEMKGVMSDSQNLFSTRLQQDLMQGTIYQHLSGGDPSTDLTSLTYDELVAFHRSKYHPSNCLFYSYGNFALEDHLETIDKTVLSQFDASDSVPPVIISPLPEGVAPTSSERHITGPDDGVSPTAASQTKWCRAHIVPGLLSTDSFECFVLRLLSYLLLNGPSAPLYQALITSELAVDFAAGTGLDTSTLNPSFGVGVEGFDDLDTIKATIDATLKDVVRDGFDQARIDAVLHQIELSQKHIVGRFGMSLLRAVTSTWCHRGDYLDNLSINPVLDRFHNEMAANPRYLQDMLDKYIVQPHLATSVALLMTPSTSFVSEQEAKERRTLDEMAANLSDDDKNAIASQAKVLAEHQQQVPNVDCLPTLTVQDIPRLQPRLDVSTSADTGAQFVPQTTNEITYIRMKFDTADVPSDLRWFLPLFSAMLGQLGTSKHAFYDIGTVLQTVSGGVSCSHLILPDTHDIDAHAESLVVESLCLPHHISSTLSLLEQLFSDTQYTSPDNLQQIKSLLVSASASANASIASSGHALAGYRAQLGMTSHAVLSERARGLTSMDALQRWVDAVEADPAALEALASIFRHLAGICFRRHRMQLSVVTEPSLINQVDTHLANMTWQLSSDAHFKLDDVVAALGLPTGPDAAVVPDKAFFGYPIAVNFNVLSFASVPLFHADHAPLSVLGQVLSSCHLHQHVRERGGAYGCSAAQVCIDSIFGIRLGGCSLKSASHSRACSMPTMTHTARTCWSSENLFSRLQSVPLKFNEGFGIVCGEARECLR
ncbi:hypothetical protein, variant [Aphanomyces invadans]|uniref:Peptidase M16C associated domain-containing protein n=1 Tax=Aphanomyces invadans TaxID=157072 RepID=A0A024TC18_9STRA|nr:hypothetical protein, variant [Aphanomyces invadans]ETV91146.1 hypothetical protein, variant [Aphanomyces invadans]|eukprot:XP_008880176.1 hypothetical protein, variant [Aphanomyces invadans]